MKILLLSVVFSPSIGGVETVSSELAEAFTALGCEVIVVTQTAEHDFLTRRYRLIRRPNALQLLGLVRWSDVVFHNNINLRSTWPLLLVRRPWVIAHHMWLPRTGRNAFGGHLKRFVSRLAFKNVAVSSVMATDVGGNACVIANPYDSKRFRLLQTVTRRQAIIFVGRLVSDKGVDLLLEALALLNRAGKYHHLTIVGDGPEEDSLRTRSSKLSLERQVTFIGSRTGDALVELLNAHNVIAIPSRWREPFGLVALEGIACGCVAVAADGGGLREAIGACGLTFARGSVSDLANKLDIVLSDVDVGDLLRKNSISHLARFERDVVAAKYLGIFHEAINGSASKTSEASSK